MRRTMLVGVALVFWVCSFGQAVRAAPQTYDFEGYVVGSKVSDPTVALPPFLVPCGCEGFPDPVIAGTLVVDLSLPPAQRLLELRVGRFPNDIATLEVIPGQPETSVVSQSTSELGTVAPPHWEIVTAKGRTGPLEQQQGRSIGISVQWSGEPGAPRQYPAGAQDVDLAQLTPKTSWRITFTLSDASTVYAVSHANIVLMHRRGSGGVDYDENFDDGAAQGWTPHNGQWSATTKDLRNAANTSFTSNTIGGLELPGDFVMLTDVYLSWGATGNTAGILFNYHGPGDFYEVRLNARGTAQLNEVRGGVRQMLDSNPYPGAGTGRFHTIYVVKKTSPDAATLDIEINGTPTFSLELPVTGPAPALQGGTAGVFASWNMARFDNVLIGAPISGFFGGGTRFDDADSGFPAFSAERGTWTVANGFIRSSANQEASIALTQGPTPTRVYGISARMRLEWSGAGNWGGFVYDYVDSRNYREARFSRSIPGRLGEIVLADVINGVRHEVFRTRRLPGSEGPELLVTLRRENDRTLVNDSSGLTNVQVRQAPPPAIRQPGLFAAWNLVQFDDVMIYWIQEQ